MTPSLMLQSRREIASRSSKLKLATASGPVSRMRTLTYVVYQIYVRGPLNFYFFYAVQNSPTLLPSTLVARKGLPISTVSDSIFALVSSMPNRPSLKCLEWCLNCRMYDGCWVMLGDCLGSWKLRMRLRSMCLLSQMGQRVLGLVQCTLW